MAGSKHPKPLCHGSHPTRIDDGTMCRTKSPAPGLLRAHSGHATSHHVHRKSAHTRVPGMSALKGDKAIQAALKEAIRLLEKRKDELSKLEWDKATEDDFKGWFGTTTKEDRALIQKRIEKSIKKLKSLKVENFVAVPHPTKSGKTATAYRIELKEYQSEFAYVNPDSRDHGKYETIVHIGPQFAKAKNDTTRAGTLIHEVSHFYTVQDTEDVVSCKIYRHFNPGEKIEEKDWMTTCRVYGYAESKMLAEKWPKMALINADNFEFFVERHDPKKLKED